MFLNALDSFIRLGFLFQAGLCHALTRLVRDPDSRLKLEIQAMGCWMLWNNFHMLPGDVKRRVYIQVVFQLMIFGGLIGAMRLWQ